MKQIINTSTDLIRIDLVENYLKELNWINPVIVKDVLLNNYISYLTKIGEHYIWTSTGLNSSTLPIKGFINAINFGFKLGAKTINIFENTSCVNKFKEGLEILDIQIINDDVIKIDLGSYLRKYHTSNGIKNNIIFGVNNSNMVVIKHICKLYYVTTLYTNTRPIEFQSLEELINYLLNNGYDIYESTDLKEFINFISKYM